MESGYAIAADIMAMVMFMYMPGIYFLTPRRGNRYLNLGLLVLFYMMWEIPTRFGFLSAYAKSLLVINHIWLFVLICMLYRNDWKRKVLCTVYVMGNSLVVELLTMLLMLSVDSGYWYQFMTWETEEVFLNTGHLMALLVSEVLNTTIALVYLIFRKLKKQRYYLGFLLLPLYQFMIVIGFFMLVREFSIRAAMIGAFMGIFNLLLDGIMLYLLEGMFHKLHTEEELSRLEDIQREEFEVYQDTAQKLENIRGIRHDLVNQLQVLHNMMDSGEDAEKIKSMMERMKEKLEGE